MAAIVFSDPQVRRELLAYVALGALDAADRSEFAPTDAERQAATVEMRTFATWMEWIKTVGFAGGRGSRFS